MCVLVAMLGCLMVCGMIGTAIGEARGRPGLGFLVGFLFGPMGLIVACLLPPPVARPVPRRKIRGRRIGEYGPPEPIWLNEKGEEDPLGFLNEPETRADWLR